MADGAALAGEEVEDAEGNVVASPLGWISIEKSLLRLGCTLIESVAFADSFPNLISFFAIW